MHQLKTFVHPYIFSPHKQVKRRYIIDQPPVLTITLIYSRMVNFHGYSPTLY